MGGYVVSEVGTGAGERIDGRMNGTHLTSGSIAWSGASGGTIMGVEAGVQNELVEIQGICKK